MFDLYFFFFGFKLAPKGKTPSGGDVWVLLITDTKPMDSDLYVCELNSDPPIKSFHSLRGKTLEYKESRSCRQQKKKKTELTRENLSKLISQ